MSSNNSAIVAELILKLCNHYAKGNKDCAEDLFRFATQYVKSVNQTRSQKDEFHVLDQVRKQALRIHGDLSEKCVAELLIKLQSKQVPINRANILSLFLQLSRKKNIQLPPVISSVPVMDTNRGTYERNLLQKYSSGLSVNASNSNQSAPLGLLYVNSAPYKGSHESTIIKRGISSSSSLVKTSSVIDNADSGVEVPETVLLQDLLYAFQGVEGKILKADYPSLGFKIDPKVHLSQPQEHLVLRLAELGWLHNQVCHFCNTVVASKSNGLIAQSLVTALKEELTEYCRLVAVLQSQIQQETPSYMIDSPLSEEQPLVSHSNRLTLRRLAVWTMEPMKKMKWLVAVIDACKNKKGGELASCLHTFLQHGDPQVKETVKHLLRVVCRPMYKMLSRWILDGELEDPYGEFFIAANCEVKGNELWHKRYRVLDTMVPSFISLVQAKKILATGKNINFLREICQDHRSLKGRDELKEALECTSVEALFLWEREEDLVGMMETAYRETSRRVLDVLMTQCKFMDHLQAIRRYLLLGQGDFIRYLMELLEPILKKPASQLYTHNLSGILDNAIRSSNAQYEDKDILQRLDAFALQTACGDIGWDVFSLDYKVHGPIETILSPCSSSYLMLFNMLWRTKRMEWILSVMWKRQASTAKMLHKIPELASVMHRLHLLISEMVHFVHQMQYYILFEVLECSWDVLIRQVQQAESLDDIIKAHNSFLVTVKAGALLDENSRDLATQLRAVYDLILQLELHEEKLYNKVLEEVQRRTEWDNAIEVTSEHSEFGESSSEDEKEISRRRKFVNGYLANVKVEFRILSRSYQDVVKRFLIMSASQTDVSLQLLSFRLDFNEHYKRCDARITAPLTYHHRRTSVMLPSKMKKAN